MNRSSLLTVTLVLAAASGAKAQQRVHWIAPPAASMLFASRTGSASAADTSHGIRPTQWQKGLVIGGVIGGVGLGAFIFAFCEGLNESGDSCSGPALGGAAIGALIGGTVGALIGGQIPKRSEDETEADSAAARPEP